MSEKDLLGELRYHGETDPWCNAAVTAIEKLQRDLRDWQDSSEAYRRDALVLRFRLGEAVDYADGAAQMDGMPADKQCKRLTFNVIERGQTISKVWDVSAARETVKETAHLNQQTGDKT